MPQVVRLAHSFETHHTYLYKYVQGGCWRGALFFRAIAPPNVCAS